MHESLPELPSSTLRDDLRAIRSQIPLSLVNEDGLGRIEEILNSFPAELSNFWGLEIRLNHETPLADVLFQIKRDTLGHLLLAGIKQEDSELNLLCDQYPFWADLRKLALAWAEKEKTGEDGLLDRHLLNLWLEFDTEALLAGHSPLELLAQPSVFFGFNSRELNFSEQASFLAQISALFPPHSLLGDTLLPFLRGIPAPGKLFQLGTMLGRPTGDLRVCVNDLGPEQIPDWLSDLGWEGDQEALSRLLKRLSPMTRNFAIDLNLTPKGPAQKIGIECYLQKPEETFLDLLQDITLCIAEKCQALLAYCGTTNLPGSRRRSKDGAQQYMLSRYIHHIKLGFQGSQVTDTKAYLAVHRPGFYAEGDWYIT